MRTGSITFALITASIAMPMRVAANAAKSPLEQVAVYEHLGTTIDGQLSFTDQTGRSVKLGDYLDGTHPLLLTLNYFRCRMLCNLQLTHFAASLRALGSDRAKE